MKQGIGWPIGIATILGLTVVANIWVMRVANNDPSFAIEPDYYKKAVAFDSTIAEERRSATLGWTARSTITGADSAVRVTVVLNDAAQHPLQGATVTITALANARANDVLSATLVERTPGTYDAPLAARFVGEWEVRVDAVRGADHFVASTRTNVARVVSR
jgi:nitrogen fixation protein FixH